MDVSYKTGSRETSSARRPKPEDGISLKVSGRWLVLEVEGFKGFRRVMTRDGERIQIIRSPRQLKMDI